MSPGPPPTTTPPGASEPVAPDGIGTGPDGVPRCAWCLNSPRYMAYHDEEWGVPRASDDLLFQKLCLEGFQAGLSWATILNKREAFRRAFHNFHIDDVAAMTSRDVVRLMQDASIVRHQKKIESAINNARVTRALIDEQGSLAAFIEGFRPDPQTRPKRMTLEVLKTQTTTPASKALSAALKKRGFTFIGPTTAYAFMQAVGLVNDHVEGCAFRHRTSA